MRVRPAEIGRRGILADLDDAAADRAGAGEVLEQRLAVAAADRARELGEILVEGAEHFQHRVLVGQKYVAPHRRIGGRDAGEVAKAAGGEFHHFRRRDLAEFVGGADDGVGDQMRQMAGDRQHQIVMLGRHDLDPGADRGPERAQLFDGGGIGALRRRQNAPAIDEQFGEAGIRTRMLGAGHRMRRNEMHALAADAAPCRGRRRP